VPPRCFSVKDVKWTVGSPEAYYLEYELFDGNRVILKFDNENDRDGCHISLDMYKVQLGPVDMSVLEGITMKFGGQVVTPSS
jgi:hypothetical protein